MSRIILQPASNKDAQAHFADTIAKPVPVNLLQEFLSAEEIAQLNDIYPSGYCPTWGVTPSGINQGKWNQISVGDTTLFSASGKIFASGVTTYKVHNSALAAKLWQYDPKGQTWEYIYFLDEIKQQHISYTAFNKVVGYAPNFIIQGFSVLDETKSKRLFEAFDLLSDVYLPPVTNTDFDAVTISLDNLSQTDGLIQTTKRLEQARFRHFLFGHKTVGNCGICGESYPVSFLVTAHIKKRSHCTDQEKRDMHVVMPMCKFGCDDLFENGYIGVDDGAIIKLGKPLSTPTLTNAINKLVGKTCHYFTSSRESYFQWHRHYHTT